MSQQLPEYTTQDLLAFYGRVKPLLDEWLAKPVWTGSETAMLCAGYVPHDVPEYGKSAAYDQPESIQESVPIDPQGFLPPNYQLCTYYLKLLTGKEAAPPRHMVKVLEPVGRQASLVNVREGHRAWVEVRRPFKLGALRELQWFFIIGNAVGLQVPALVPFGLLDELSSRLRDRPVSDSETVKAQTQPTVVSAPSKIESAESPVNAPLTSEATPKAMRRNVKKSQSLKTTPEERRYHTTEEVAGLTGLAPDTLNKYARDGRPVEGFTPFKRQYGKSWYWRDNQQQAAYEVSTAADKPKHSVK